MQLASYTCKLILVIPILGCLSLSVCQDWFSSHLGQLVMELATSGGVVAPPTSSPGSTVTDGTSMSTMASTNFSEEDPSDQERMPLDLTE